MDYILGQDEYVENLCWAFASCPFSLDICWSRDTPFQERDAVSGEQHQFHLVGS